MDFDDEAEGLLAAIDQRKYKIFKEVIDWNQVKNLLDDCNEAKNNEVSDEQTEADDEAEDSDTMIQ